MPGIEETENEYRYRLKDPGMFISESFRRKNLPDPGLSLILGKMQDSDSMVAQSLRFDKKSWNREKVMNWVKSHKDQFSIEPANLYTVKNVEIFSVGTWNGKEIKAADLDSIVDAFSKTKNIVRPFLKLGHDDNQKILQADGLPAAGWVENVRKSGQKLIADFVDVPKKIYQLIKNKAYRKVSCEIYSNVKMENCQYPKMLGAVSLLGSDLPAVLNLNDILSLYSSGHDFSTVESFTSEKNYDTIIVNDIKNKSTKDSVMPELEKLQFKLEESEKTNQKLQDQIEKLTQSVDKFKTDLKLVSDQKAEAETKILEAQKKEFDANVDKFISEITADKVCSKAMQPLIKDLFSNETEKFTIGEKETDKFGLVKEILKLSAEASKVNFSETTSKTEETVDDVEKIEKYAKEKGVSFSQAYRELNK